MAHPLYTAIQRVPGHTHANDSIPKHCSYSDNDSGCVPQQFVRVIVFSLRRESSLIRIDCRSCESPGAATAFPHCHLLLPWPGPFCSHPLKPATGAAEPRQKNPRNSPANKATGKAYNVRPIEHARGSKWLPSRHRRRANQTTAPGMGIIAPQNGTRW